VNRTTQLVWGAVRVPIAAVLLMLEPFVGFICGAGLVLGLISCAIFELSPAGAAFPLGKALMISLSFGVILFLYYGVLSLFVKD
jgi:hypothetical protein